MKIFLAGATGALGRVLLPLLVEAGYEVIGTTRSVGKREQIEAAGGKSMVVNALDREAIFAALDSTRPDVVIHQLTDLSTRNFAANSHLRIEGTRNLVDAAKAVGVQRMIAQSISWVCVAGELPSQEDELLDFNAPSPRAETIAAVHALEQAVSEIPVGVILRYGIFYGPNTWFDRDGLTTQQIQRGEIEATDAITSFIHVRDAAQAAVMALGWAAGVVNIVDDEPATGKEWVSLYASLIGAKPPMIKSGRQGWERGASNAKARLLGWRPLYPSWRDGFQEVLG